ncbi:MAG TPA: endonuclease III [Ignavibacteria bacterium]|nr:endonuclease III [Ignavibacteria bacterium]HMR41710.1 endonuclease III [Ignavibacteria bacterium]
MKTADKKKAAAEIIRRLAKEFPNSKCHLDFKSPFELLVSTVLAAQCTDVRVNATMLPLYNSKYKSPEDILQDGLENFRHNIRSINFFNNKAKAVLSICKSLVENYKGKVPGTMEDLTSFAGVGRKSASVVMGNCFGKNDVIIVDTHLKRVSSRLGLIENENPDKIEIELKEIIPAKDQFHFSMRIGELGRQICKAKKPDCEGCFMNDICVSAFKFN